MVLELVNVPYETLLRIGYDPLHSIRVLIREADNNT